ncbi:MAG TPA: AAA-like domain-containing protein [Pseudomonadota bacterium]|nr:AAA-like domain-containing protein [Pseudomonadota bacterium]
MCHAYGYGGGQTEPSVLFESEISTPWGEDPQRGPAIVLKLSLENTNGALPGCPVLQNGLVIGHLKSRVDADSGKHTLYVCPIRFVEALIPHEAESKKRTLQPPHAAYDPAWYVSREDEEQKALGYLDFPGQPVVLWAPELFGKTWLLRHLLSNTQKHDAKSQVVAINLDLFDKSGWQQQQGLEPFLRELALHIGLALGETTETVQQEWTTSSPTANLDRFMRRRILPKVTEQSGRLFLAIDRADAVLGSPFQNTFFGILRGWAEAEESWSCLRLLLSISTTPALLVSNRHQSPFNLTDAVELRDMNDTQVQKLCDLYHLSWGKEERGVLRNWVGGHPYLVRLALFNAVKQNVSPRELFDPGHPAFGVFDRFLNRVTERLRAFPERFEALQRVLVDPATDLRDAELPLMRAGILVRDAENHHFPRYELYQKLAAKTPSGRRIGQGKTTGNVDPTALVDTDLDLKPSQLSVEKVEVGKVIGNYHVRREIGRGGMGIVYEVFSEPLKKRAALKLLHAHFSRDPELSQRFLNEARCVNIIQHPSIINIYEMGQLKDGSTYFIMEFLEGESMADRLEKVGKLPLPEALRLAHQIASALSATHEKGIVHRDLKPDNVMLVRDSAVVGGRRVKLLDFGLAKVSKGAFDDSITTEKGTLMGTPIYMSPEQCRGAENVDAKTDVYSLGVMLYEFVHGKPPFMAIEPGDLMAMHIRDKPRPLEEAEPSLPKTLTRLVHDMLIKTASSRPSMNAVSDTLRQLEQEYASSPSASYELAPRRKTLFASSPFVFVVALISGGLGLILGLYLLFAR